MSFDNPFESPSSQAQPQHPQIQSTPPMPALATAVFILALILGVLGLLGVLFGILGMVFQSISSGMAGNEEAQKLAKEVAAKQFVPNVIVILMNAIVAPCLVVGGIAGLRRSPWALKFLTLTFVAAILYKIVSTAITIWMQYSMKDLMLESMVAQNPDPRAAEMMEATYSIIFVSTIVVATLFSLMMIGFYAFGIFYLKKPKVTEAFPHRNY